MVRNQNLAYKVERFDFQGVARFVVYHRYSGNAPMCTSLYEAYLFSRRKPKKGTSGLILQHLIFLYAWAELVNFNLERELLAGSGLQLPEISLFTNWLRNRSREDRGLSDGYIAHIIRDCKIFVVWFVKRYVAAKEHEALNITIHQTALAHHKAWADFELNVKTDLMAEDISDEDYEVIESYFRRGNSLLQNMQGADLRNYIIWRLTWEFGLRIGEVLALRLQDLQLNRNPPYLSIVNLEDRGWKELDPRSPYQPKVKTLSRELGFIFSDTSLLDLLEAYVTKSRYRDFVRNGKTGKSAFLDHDYLLILHNGSGLPLSGSAAQKISASVAFETGTKFKWHLVRHAFFNRRYTEASAISDNTHLMNNLVYWGGWRSEESLKRYSRRAIRDIARCGLIKRLTNE